MKIFKKLLNTILAFVLFCFFGLQSVTIYGQSGLPQKTITPGGILDNVYDLYGNQYRLEDLKTPKAPSNSTSGRPTALLSCGGTSMFNLYFEQGCGMDNISNATDNNRRAVVCKVFQDLSDYINGPLDHGMNPTRVNIWIRDISQLDNVPSNALAVATGFYIYPQTLPTLSPASVHGAIMDSEIWKTIHAGVDSYTNVASPPLVINDSFFHGQMAIDFNRLWNTDANATSFSETDLYTVVLHEITHALGFRTMIGSDGTSQLGTTLNLFSRYDSFLMNGTSSLINTTAAPSVMYNPVFNSASLASLPNIDCENDNSPDPATCESQISFVGTNTVPVFNPTACYLNGSSLSHFEDSCYPINSPHGNNNYFVMSNATPPAIAKRFHTIEERQALADIGYDFTNNFNGHNYTNNVTGIDVAGINDGMTTTGNPSTTTYTYNINASTSLITPINLVIDSANHILNNDFCTNHNNLRFEGLQDVYHDGDGTTSITTSDSNNDSNTSIIFSSTEAGVHLLRYVPFNTYTGMRGNVTYVYIFVQNTCGVATPCNLVINGDFEQHINPLLPATSGLGGQVVCAINDVIGGTSEYYSGDFTTGNQFYTVPLPSAVFCLGLNDSITENNSFIGAWQFGEPIRMRLSNPLLPNRIYQFSCNIARNFGEPFNLQIILSENSNITQFSNQTIFTDQNLVGQNPCQWETSTITFNSGAGGQTFLYLGRLTNVASPSYCFIDNVSLVPLDHTFNLPTTICSNETLTNLYSFITPSLPTTTATTFSVDGNTISGSIFNASSYTVGPHTISFTNTSNLGCPVTVTDTITITAPPTLGAITGANTINVGSTTTYTNTTTGGVWTSSNPAVAMVDAATGVVTGSSAGTATITYTVTGVNGCIATTSSTITVQLMITSCPATTVWNGTSWSNGTPNTSAYLNTAVVFNATYTANENLFACTVVVNSPAHVTINHIGLEDTTTANTLTVNNEVVVATGALLEFKDDASLVQINDNANTGNIKYNRTTPNVANLDYTYWSSPVAGQSLYNLSPETRWDRYDSWNPLINDWVQELDTNLMNTGQGYSIRGSELNDSALPFKAYFEGVPHNGTITIPVYYAPSTTPLYNEASNSNLIGNPYPSGLDIDCFLADPANAHLNGTVYLWSHNIPIDTTGATQQGAPGNEFYNYNVNSYTAYNRMGGVGTGITKIDLENRVFSSNRPLGKIAAGQGFFIETSTTGVATFKNSMRVGSQNQGNSQFYKSATQALLPAETSTCITEERHRLWLQLLNLTATPQQFKQTLLGYSPLATTSSTLDRNYDAVTYVLEPYTIDFYTLSPGAGTPLTIQGRNLGTTFNTADVIPLGYTCKLNETAPNTIQLGISEEDGLFDNQEVYLRENQGGIFNYFNLKAAPYNFTISGNEQDITNRFAIVFTAPNTTKLETASCGKTNMQLSQWVRAITVTGQQGFQWLVTRQSDNQQTTITTTSNLLYLNNTGFANGFIRFNETYCIRVKVQVAGVWSAYGAECCITTANPTTQLTNCGGYTLTFLTDYIVATQVSSAPGYHWEITNMTTNEVRTFDTTSYSFQFNNSALTTPTGFVSFNTQYCIKVRPLNIGNIDNLSFASTCCITTPNPTTQLVNCGGYTLATLTQYIPANLISSATGYHWEITNMATGAVRTINTATTSFNFGNVGLTTPIGFVAYNTQYCIRVRPLNMNSVDNLSYGTSCCINTPNPTTQLVNCGGYTLTSLTQNIPATSVPSASGYHWEVQNSTTGAVRAFNTTSASFTFSNAALTTPAGFVATNSPYCIKVRPKNIDGQDNLSYGATCCLTSNAFKHSETTNSFVTSKEETTIFSVVAAPNPFNNGFQLHLTTPLDSKVQVAFYNVLGQLIENDSYTVEALENHLFAADLATGVYQVSIRQEEYNQIIKVIKN